MSIRYRLPLAAMLALLLAVGSGCTSAPERVETAPVSETATDTGPEPPQVELTSKLLYQLLVAEFSGQQGALRLSADTYLEAAQRTRDYRLARRATRIAIYARENTMALKAARLWVELDPGDEEAHKSVAALLIATGEQDKAQDHLQWLLNHEKQRGNNGYMLIASLLATDPDKQRAMHTMDALTADATKDPDALFARAHLASELGDVKRTQTELHRLLSIAPDHTQGLILQARVLNELGDTDGALKSINQALSLSPDNHQLRLTYARMLVDARRLKEARKQFKILGKAAPRDADVIYALGLLAMEAGDLDDAEAQFKKLLQLQEREEESRFALAQIAEERKQYDKAIEWFSSIAQGERYIEAHLHAARLIAKQQGLEQARRYLRELETQNDDERVDLYLAEAELFNKGGEHQKAMEVYNEGLQQFPDNTDLLYARGMTAEKLDRLDAMEQDFRRILKLKPDDAHTLNALGYTLVDRTDRLQEGFDYIKRAYKQQPEDVAILDSMGWALYRLGRLEEALDYLQRAADKLRDGEIAAHLGEVMWVSGKKEEARKIWQKALELSPDHKVLQQTIQRFNP